MALRGKLTSTLAEIDVKSPFNCSQRWPMDETSPFITLPFVFLEHDRSHSTHFVGEFVVSAATA